MNALEAGQILDRLTGHWPSLVGSDGAADDWIRVIRDSVDALEAADVLVQGWNRDRNPKIADWQETCRQIARRRMFSAPRYAIEEPEHRLSKAELAAILKPARDVLAGKARK